MDVIPREELPSAQASELAEAAKAQLEQVITDPEKRFYDVRREAWAVALAARMGSYKVGFDRRIGPFGDVTFDTTDPRNLRWCEGYHPHDPRCPWVYEKARIRSDLIPLMEGWKNTENLRGDSGVSGHSATSGPPGTVSLQEEHGPNLRPSNEYTWTTVVYLYERNLSVTKRIESGRVDLKPGERYMVCAGPNETGCGYRSDTQADQQRDGDLGKGEELPPTAIGACPGLEEGSTCGLDLKRVDQVAQEFDDEGEHRFTVFAPFESGPEGSPRVFVEPEPWPYDTRTVPYVFLWCYVRPFKPMGQSETSINRSYIMAMNMLDRLGLETMMLSRPVWAVPNCYVDINGEQWEFGDKQGLCAYYDPFAGNAAPMQLVQAPGLPAAWGELRGAQGADLREDMGTNDITFGQNDTKDIPVGTVQRLEKLGEIPVNDQIAAGRREESFGMMVALDIIRAAYTEKRLLRMKGKDGSRVFNLFRGADLPNFDIIVTDDPNALQFQGEIVDNLLKVLNQPPPVQKFLARALNISASTLKDFQEEMKTWQKSQAPPGAGPGGPQGGGPPLPSGIASRMGPATPAGNAPPMNGAAG